MTMLLWVRTKLRLTSYPDDEIDHYSDSIRDCGASCPEPFFGGDHLLWPLEYPGSIHGLKSAVAPLMQGDLVDDWSLTAVGSGVGREVEVESWVEHGLHYSSWDDRFLDHQALEESDIPIVEGLSSLAWQLDYDAGGATALWVNFVEDIDQNQFRLKQLERALPGRPAKMWHGRSSITFGYRSSHDLRQPNAYGLTQALRELLDEPSIEDWLAFEVGNESVGGTVANMNLMRDFILANHRSVSVGRRPLQVSRRPTTPAKTVVVVQKKSKPSIRFPRQGHS